MKYEIKSQWGSTILFTAEAASLLLAVEAAIKSGANLFEADLFKADLFEADLFEANLSRANLSRANLSGADLSRADLSRANLSRANLSGADLSRANLFEAGLFEANLSRANLSRANLSGADLSGADLSRANLFEADLSGASLFRVDLSDIKNGELALARTVLLPEGNLVGWKKCQGNVIVKLLIPQRALRSSASGRKCRANYVQVLRVFNGVEGISVHDGKTVYRKGETVHCDKWNEDRWIECSGGIHFYLTRIEAEHN